MYGTERLKRPKRF